MQRLCITFALAVLAGALDVSSVTECSPDVTCEATLAPSLLQQQQVRKSVAKPTRKSLEFRKSVAKPTRKSLELGKSAAKPTHKSLEEPSEILHAGEDCLDACGGKGGYCSWCGQGNACCQFGLEADEHGCHSARLFKTMTFHQCVRVEVAVSTNKADEEFLRQVAEKKAELGIASGTEERGELSEEDQSTVVEDSVQEAFKDEDSEKQSSLALEGAHGKESEENQDDEISDLDAVAAMEAESGAADQYAEKLSEQDKIAAVGATLEAAKKFAAEQEAAEHESKRASREFEETESAAERAWRDSSASKVSVAKKARKNRASRKAHAHKMTKKKVTAAKPTEKVATKKTVVLDAAVKKSAKDTVAKQAMQKVTEKDTAFQRSEGVPAVSRRDRQRKSVAE